MLVTVEENTILVVPERSLELLKKKEFRRKFATRVADLCRSRRPGAIAQGMRTGCGGIPRVNCDKLVE